MKKLEKWGTFVASVTHDLNENLSCYDMASLPYKIHEWFSMFS